MGFRSPPWRADSKEIFYIGPKGTLTAVRVNSEGTFSTVTPMPLFQIRGPAPISSTDLFTYDVAKDGKRFLVNRYVKPEHVVPLTVVFNATAQPQQMRRTVRFLEYSSVALPPKTKPPALTGSPGSRRLFLLLRRCYV